LPLSAVGLEQSLHIARHPSLAIVDCSVQRGELDELACFFGAKAHAPKRRKVDEIHGSIRAE